MNASKIDVLGSAIHQHDGGTGLPRKFLDERTHCGATRRSHRMLKLF
jgi:hypothetical protein